MPQSTEGMLRAKIVQLKNSCNEKVSIILVNSLFPWGNFCCRLITFANSLDQDQDRHSVCPDLDPNRLTLRSCP